MNGTMEIQPGQCVTDERELKELLRRADFEAEQRKRTYIPSSSTRTLHRDEVQAKLTRMAKEALGRAMKSEAPQGTSHKSDVSRPPHVKEKVRLRLEDIDDDTFVRSITEPTVMVLD